MSALFDRTRGLLERDRRISAWQIRSRDTSGLSFYLVRTEVETERSVAQQEIDVAVFVRHDGLLGRSTIRLMPGDGADPEAKLGQAVYMAGLGGDEPYEIAGPAEIPPVSLLDPSLTPTEARSTLRQIVDAWGPAVSGLGSAGPRPGSGEIFASIERSRLETSSGIVQESEASRLSVLAVLLASKGDKEAERIVWQERRRAADLDIEEILRRAAEEASALTLAQLPPSGRFPVLIDAGELGALLSPIVSQSSAEGIYRKESRFEIGKAICEEGGVRGFSLSSNAILPYGTDSYAIDGDGVPGSRVEIVKDGIFTRAWARKQYADYLKMPPSGAFANLELAEGMEPFESLLAGDGPVLHVKSFSWLSPDDRRGAFSSEIRLGYWIERGVKTPVKGGTVSGNLYAALPAARFTRERVFLGNYLGPSAVMLDGLDVTGR